MSLEDYYAQQKRLAESAKKSLLALAKRLKQQKSHAVKVVAHYDGSGDSGQIENITAFSKLLLVVPIDLDKLFLSTDPQIKNVEDAFYYILDAKYGGYENNAGGFGDVVLYVTGKDAPRIVIEHNRRVEDSEYEEYEA